MTNDALPEPYTNMVGLHGNKNLKFGGEKATPRPKPAPPKKDLKKIEEATPLKVVQGNEKPKFVRKPHLTERPFKSHEGMQALAKQLESTSQKRSRPKKDLRPEALKLKGKGYSNVAIGRELGIAESSVRNLIKPKPASRTTKEKN